MLRDPKSYEVQIIDAVRSVNKALGGTYGTSSAIYKNEFNQYEVQLIDAIRGISRTLNKGGLSIAGGTGATNPSGGGVSKDDFISLSGRVTTLESESFFRLVDGNVTLKEQYANLWVPGWISAGGINSGSGGGGVSYLKELTDIYHDANGVLRADGSAVRNGDVLVYDSVNGRWNATAASGGSVSTEIDPVFSASAAAGITSADITNWNTKGTVTSVTLSAGTGITVSNSGKAITTSGSRTISISSTYQTRINNGNTAYGWGDHSLVGYAMASDLAALALRVTAIEDWFEVVNVGATEAPVYALHAKNSYAIYSDSWISAGGANSGSGGGGGSTVIWGAKSGNTRPLTVNGTTETLLLDGALSGYATQSWVQGQGYVSSQALSGYVTLDTAQTITGAKTFSANLTASANLIVGGTVSVNGVNSIDQSNTAMSLFNYGARSSKTFDAYGTGANLRACDSNGNTANLLSVQSSLIAVNSKIIPNYMTGIDLGGSSTNQRWANIYGVNADLTGNLSLSSASYINLGPIRLVYDLNENALHVTSNDNSTINLYCDGYISAGGVQASS